MPAQMSFALQPVTCPQCRAPLDLTAPHDPGGTVGIWGLITRPCHIGCELPPVTLRPAAFIIRPPAGVR